MRLLGQFQTFLFFYEKILDAQKAQKAHNAHKQTKIKKQLFMCLKNI